MYHETSKNVHTCKLIWPQLLNPNIFKMIIVVPGALSKVIPEHRAHIAQNLNTKSDNCVKWIVNNID